jgi:hemoglobin
MRVAIDSLDLPPEQAAVLWDYFENAAQFMINTPG